MSPDVQYMRNFVSRRYPYLNWEERVARMSDDQVMAIYFRMIEEKPKPKPPPPEPEEKEPPNDTLF